MINFKANLLNTANVKIRTGGQKYEDYKVSFVKLDTNSKSDLRAIKEVDRKWDSCCSLANNISYFLEDCWLKNDSADLSFYALTTQRNNFEYLNSDDIIGLAQITKDSPTTIFLDYLQVDPENNYFAFAPIFKKVGTAIIDSLKRIFSGRELLLEPLVGAEPFYKKLGFEWIPEGVLSKKL